MKRSKSSQNWLRRHFDDFYVKEAHKAGYRSRAVYKLLEIQKKDRILRPGMVVVDLGAAPGSWTEIAAPLVGDSGKVFAMDILDIDPIDKVTFIQGDFTEQEVYDSLLEALNGGWLLGPASPCCSRSLSRAPSPIASVHLQVLGLHRRSQLGRLPHRRPARTQLPRCLICCCLRARFHLQS